MALESKEALALALAERIEAVLGDNASTFNSIDEETRRRLSEAARKLSLATELSGDTVHRIVHSPLQLPLARLGEEIGLFKILDERGGKAANNAELASATGVDPVLMKRLLRYYQSLGMISQIADDQYRANNITSAMVSLAGHAGIILYLDMLSPAFNALPQFLRDTKYANITDGSNCPWNLSQGTDKSPFEWVKEVRPDLLNVQMSWMVGQHGSVPSFFDVFDFEEFVGKEANENTPVFVDIGGGFGQQCIALRQKYPGLVGRIILQDREEVIEKAKACPLPGFQGIDTQPYDFFTPQPVQGARVYYLRNILHDWTEEKCVEILKNIRSAMTQESQIVIEEIVMPENGAHWRSTQMDLAMGSFFAAMERSQKEWDSLVDKAGLRISKIQKNSDQLDECIIVAVPR